MSGGVIVISGPGGVGKGTVVAELVARDPVLALSRSWTTRDRRPGEADDAYTFVDDATFEAAIDSGNFLEWDHHFGAYYGSPRPEEGSETDLILEIDVNGARQIHEGGHEALFVFIDTPSIDIQRERILARGDDPVKAEERIEGGQTERGLAETLPYVFVVNDDLDRCVEEILGLIRERRDARNGAPASEPAGGAVASGDSGEETMSEHGGGCC